MRTKNLKATLVRDRIRVAISDSMDGLPVVINRMSLTIWDDATDADMQAIGEVLFESKNATCDMNFMIGDWWNCLTERRGDGIEFLRNIMPDATPDVIDRLYKECRNNGWIARKWPENLREPKFTWRWYKQHKPEDLHQGKTEVETSRVSDAGDNSNIIPLVGKHSNNIHSATYNARTFTVHAEVKWGKYTFPAWLEVTSPLGTLVFQRTAIPEGAEEVRDYREECEEGSDVPGDPDSEDEEDEDEFAA